MASILLLLVVSFAMINSASSARIVGLALMSSGSHYFLMKTVMEELAARGHEVVMLVSSDYKPSRSSEMIPHKVYQVPFKSGFLEEFLVRPAMEKGFLQLITNMVEFQRLICESLLNSTELLQDLRNFDLLVYEGVALGGVLVGERLGIRRVGIFSVIPTPGSYLMPPSPISYVPLRMTGFTDKMSFLQRVMNLLAYVAFRVIANRFFLGSMAALKAKYNITPEISCGEAFGRDELVIIASDFALEYPQPLLPGQIMVGPLTVKKPNPLPAELEDFVNSNGGHGFIIVSFGSYMETVMSKERIDVFGAAFGKLKQKVLWKLKKYIPASLGPNIKAVEWLPQNDLLAHKDIKAFVSHMGIKSYHESAYHGVPVVAVPLFADQFSNAKRAANFGWGAVVDYKTANVQEVVEAIKHVVNDPRFKKEATRISTLMKDKPRAPLKAAGDWIEYVTRHGGAQHLRPQVFNIPWYQYYLLDVMAFLVSIVTLVAMVIGMTCKCLCRLCCKKSESKPKKE